MLFGSSRDNDANDYLADSFVRFVEYCAGCISSFERTFTVLILQP